MPLDLAFNSERKRDQIRPEYKREIYGTLMQPLLSGSESETENPSAPLTESSESKFLRSRFVNLVGADNKKLMESEVQNQSKFAVNFRRNMERWNGIDRRNDRINPLVNILFGGFLGAAHDLRNGVETFGTKKLFQRTDNNTSHIGRTTWAMPLLILSLASIKFSVHLKKAMWHQRDVMKGIKSDANATKYSELSAAQKKDYRMAAVKNIADTAAWLAFNIVRMSLGVAATMVAPLWNLAVAMVNLVATAVSTPITMRIDTVRAKKALQQEKDATPALGTPTPTPAPTL